MTEYKFKIGMFLNELQLPLEEALEVATDIGVEYIWFSRLINRPAIAELSDAEIDDIGNVINSHGLKHLQISAGAPFKSIDLIGLEIESMAEHPEFRKDFDDFIRSMQIAARLNVGAILVYGFAWPGEYTAAKPTWPMRWLTRGGVISDVEMTKLVKAFSMVVEQAEKYNVDAVATMMPWNYTNTTSHFRELAERVGSNRMKLMWGPADNYNCGEADVANSGFINVQPYLHSLHIKDLQVNDGIALDFEYVPFGEGDVDYATVLRNLRHTRSNVVLSVATHWTPPNGSRVEAMRTNYTNLMSLIREIEA